MAITKAKPVMLSRSSQHGDRRWPDPFTRVRDLGQAVAFYFTDNAITSRSEATQLGMAAEAAFKNGEPFTAHDVTFTISSSS